MTFTVVATAAAVASLVLGVGFLLSGPFMLRQWGMRSPAESLVMSRRIGAVYLGLSLMLWLGRSAPPSELRTAVCEGLGLAIASLATLGLYEWRARRVSAGIAVSIVVEIGLATGFMWAR